MVKKLLWYRKNILLIFLFWTSAVLAQCPNTVNISANTATTICEGTQVTFTANPTGGGQPIYLWQINGNDQSGETSSSFSPSNLNNGDKIKVIVSSSDGSGCTGVSSNILTMTVNPILEAHAEIQASSTSICPGDTVVYSITDQENHGGSQAKYEWLINGNSFSPPQTGTSLSYEPSANEEITLKLDSGLPCVDDFFTTGIAVDINSGKPGAPVSIGGSIKVCPGTEETYTVSAVSNATSYIWELPTGWNGTSSTNSITVTSGTSGGEIKVSAQNDCGPGPSQNLAVTVDPGKPAQPAAITGNTAVCPGTSETYSVPAVTNATNYTWTFPAGWNMTPIETSTPDIAITTGATGNGNISVIASNNCGDSPSRTLAVTMQPGIPNTPGTISGNTEVCPGVQETYSIGAVAQATEYVWTLPDGTEQITTSPTITVTTNSSGNSNVTVVARNSCGSSASVTKVVTVKAGIPANAGAISLIYNDSNSTICPGGSLSFSVAAPTGAESFIWTVPAGWNITDGDETSQITVTAGQYGENGNVTAKASNSCGTGPASTLAVTVDPEAPEMGSTSIEGPSEVCATGTGLVYSIPAINHANSYSWTVPTGWDITSAANGNSITVNPSATSGDISVTALNDCGASETILITAVVTGGVPGQPGAITSNISTNPTICPPYSPVTFSVPAVTGADSYIWNTPVGWDIISGEGTETITVNISAAGNYEPTETVSVQAVNLCGPGPERESFEIFLDDYIITDIGEDKTICRVRNPLTINANVSFGSASFKATITSTGNGTISTNLNNLNNVSGPFIITYVPSAEDITKNSVTLKLSVPKPNGSNTSCGNGFDEMTIFFRDNPTATISGSSEICMGSSTELSVSGTPNTIMTYTVGGADKTVNIGASGAAVIDTGVLNQTTTFNLKSIQYSEAPSCSVTITGSATVTVNPPPSVAITNFSTEYCNADPTTVTPGLTFTGTHTEGGFTSSSAALVVDLETGAFSPLGVPAGTYSITYTFDDTLGCGYQPVSTDITIYEKVTITTQPEGVRICEGQPLELSVAATGEGLTYEWYDQDGVIAGATAATLSIPSASLADEGTYYVIVSGTDSCEAVTSASAEVLVDSNISITSLSPDTSVCENGQVSFSVEASADGEVLTYQWLKDGNPITGQTSGTLTLNPVQLSDAAAYTVMISGATGFNCNTLTSNPIELTVRETPSVEITGDAAVCDGGSTVITFANGLPNGIVSYNINGGGSSTIQLDSSGNASLNTGGLTYTSGETTDYLFSFESISYPDAPDCVTSLTGAVTVKVSPVPTASFAFPGEQVAFCNSSGASSVTPTFSGTTGGEFSATGLTVDEQTGAFSPAGVAPGNYTISYSIPASGGCTEETATLDITIHKEVKITSPPSNTGICSGETMEFEVSATGDNLSYQWYKGNKPGTEIPGATSNIYKISPASKEDDGPYYVVVSGAGACSPAESEVVTLNVDENIIISTQPVDQEVCLGDDVTFDIAATATGGDPTFQWQKDGVDLPGKTGATLDLLDVSLEDAGEYTVFIEGPEGYTCSTITSGAAILTVNEPPTVEAGDPLTACYTTETIDISGGASASNYSSIEWSHDGEGNLSDPNALETTYTPAADESGTITFTLTAYGNTCAEISDTKTLEIEPVPVITAFSYAAGEFCNSDTEFKTPTLTGSHAYLNGTFTVTPATGLEIDGDGNIDPANSAPGSYEIIYSTPSGAVCDAVLSTPVTVIIGEQPIADFAYDNTIFCKDTRDDNQNTDPIISMLEGATPGAFSYTGAGTLGLNTTTGEIDLATSDPGLYTVTNTHDYTGAEEDGCALVSFDFKITISEKPIPDFTYSATEFCSDGANPVAQLTAPAVAGVFTEKAGNTGLVFADAATGEIDLAASTPGTYIIINTIAAANGCIAVSAEQEITITRKPEASFTYSKEAYCFADGIATISYPEGYTHNVTFSSVALADFLNEDTGELVWTSENAAMIVGTHDIAYTISGTGGCSDVTGTIPLVIDAVPVGGTLSFGEYGRVYTTCENPANIDVSLTLSDFTGTVLRWEYRNDSTLQWTEVSTTETSLTGVKLNEIVSYESLVFRAVVVNGACTAPVYSATAIISVIPSDIEPAPVKVDPYVVCYDGKTKLSSETGYGNSFGKFNGGAFQNAGGDNNGDGWRISKPNNETINFESSANNTNASYWLRTQPKSFSTANINTNTVGDAPWNSHADPSKKNEHFAIVQGTFSSRMETPTFNLTGMDEAVVTFDQGFNLTAGAIIQVELSRNGGGTYTDTIYQVIGPNRSNHNDHFSNGDAGINQITLDLGAYMGETSLRLRFNFIAQRPGDVWAVDNIDVPEGPQGVLLQWFYDENPEDDAILQIGQDNQEEVTFPPEGGSWSKIGWNNFEVKTTLLLDSEGNACESLENIKPVQVFVFDKYTTTVAVEVGSCGDTTAELTATVVGEFQGPIDESIMTPDGYVGEWNIIPNDGNYILRNGDENSILDPINDPYAILESEGIVDYQITWKLTPTTVFPDNFYDDSVQGLIINQGCPPEVSPAHVTLNPCTTLDFDGIDDYVDLGTEYSGTYSIEAWIRPFKRVHPDGGFTIPTEGTIISGPGFEIKMNDLPVLVQPGTRWFHIAVTGGKLFVDGIESGNAGSGSGGDRTLIGAKWNNSTGEPENYFSGWIEEVRIWNKPLDERHIQFMMNQRIAEVTTPGIATVIEGEIVPIRNVSSYKQDGQGFNLHEFDDPEHPARWYDRQWGDLAGYYRLISADPDTIHDLVGYLHLRPDNGETPNLANASTPGILHNMTTHQQNTSPLPYLSGNNGPWADKNTWLRPDVWEFPNSTGINGDTIEWNIAQTSHVIHSNNRDITLLGLISVDKVLDMQGTISPTAPTGNELYISHYLKLDGVIDLNGESQLVQPDGSLAVQSDGINSNLTGYIERDQQGTASSFNYNYWSSPVIPKYGDTKYSVGTTMFDGTLTGTGEFRNITFKPGPFSADNPKASPTAAIAISNYWIFSFAPDIDLPNANKYSKWNPIWNHETIFKGEGYTMKGSWNISVVDAEAAGEYQNYTFKGFPNNGNIQMKDIYIKQNYLIGNPYPSAISVDKFLADNFMEGGIKATNGAVYFWDHFGGKSHYLAEYVGGYATRNWTAGAPAASVDERINNSDQTPHEAEIPGAYIAVGQGFYINSTLEGDEIPEKIVFNNSQRIFMTEAVNEGNSIFHGQEKELNKKQQARPDNKPIIRLNFSSPKGYWRQIVVGAIPETSNAVDYGYDAPLLDNNSEDMFWVINDSKFVIQGVPHFNFDQVLPLGIKIAKEGKFKIKVAQLKNISENTRIYIKDNLYNLYFDITEKEFSAKIEPGDYRDRYEIVFEDPKLVDESDVILPGEFEVLYVNGTREIKLRNPGLKDIIKVYLNNILGQEVHVYHHVPTEHEVGLPVKRFSSGVYIVKVHLEGKVITEKIIIE